MNDDFRIVGAFGIMWVGAILGGWALVDYIFGGSNGEKIETPCSAESGRAIKTTKMPHHSKYYAIYNVSQGKWAQLPLSDDAETIWRDNNWPEGEGLVGFWYDEDDNDAQDIIYCPEGHVIYMAGGDIFGDEYEYHLEESTYSAPPAILVNLKNEFDTKFLRRKGEPNWWGHGSHSDCESESESESEEEPVKKRARTTTTTKVDVDDDTPQVEWPGGWRIQATIPGNRPIVDFLYRCYDATTNTFKRKAYARAIMDVSGYWNDLTEVSEYDLPRLLPELSENMIRKIREFLDGVDEEDIINS